MKRIITATLTLALLVGFASLTTGCSQGEGRYFKQTRQNQPHVFKNRVYNPADARYAEGY